MTAGRSDAGLELRPDGRYRMDRSSSTYLSAGDVVGSVSGADALEGRWSYDPASWTLTLTPDGRGEPASGVACHAYGGCWDERAARARECEYVLLGRPWWDGG